jgi:general nucleoside transport system ATP-binding protein
MKGDIALEARGITKVFASTLTRANDDISFDLRAGEIHAVVGENGAGKSTLARILAGLEHPDSGELRVKGRAVRFRRPRDAERHGIGMVPQQSLLAPGLTVAENVVLGHEPRVLGLFLDVRKAYYETALASASFNFPLNPGARVESLSPAERRQAEIIRALARGGDVVILDEPTSILTESESQVLFDLLARLRDAGTAILLISHRVREVLNAADRITILRNGRNMGTIAPSETDERDLSDRMASSSSFFMADVPSAAAGEAVFSFRGSSLGQPGRDPEQACLSDIDFDVRRGEIYGIAALAGNGLDVLEDMACGERRCEGGRMELLGRNVLAWPRWELRSSQLAYLPTDRDGKGLCLDASVLENMSARGYRNRSWSRLGQMKIRGEVARILAAADVHADLDLPVRKLSGGNRQRILRARELGVFSPAILAANPTQGLSPRAQEETWNRLRELAREGAAVLLLTSSVDELFAVADRVGVLYRGRLTELGLRGGKVTAQAVTALLTGAAA